MASFSPTDVAFEGFRLTRERPRAVIAWALCYLVFTFGLALVAELTLGPQWQTLIANFRAVANDPAAVEAASQKLTPFVFGGLPLYFAFQAVFTCAVYRAVLRPQDARAGYLRLGWDEARMFALNLILSLLWGAVIFGVLMVTALAAETASTTAPSGMVLIGDVTTVLMISLGVTVLVRLSLAGPMTFAERRLRIFEFLAADARQLLAAILGLPPGLPARLRRAAAHAARYQRDRLGRPRGQRGSHDRAERRVGQPGHCGGRIRVASGDRGDLHLLHGRLEGRARPGLQGHHRRPLSELI